MKLLTRNADYAIRALCYIAKQEKKEIVSVARLTQVLKIPRPFLRKLLQILNKKGLIKSYKGQGGGFALAVAPQKISIVRIIVIFQGSLKLSECLLGKKVCPNIKTCQLRKRIKEIEKFVIRKLDTITIAALIKGDKHS